MLACRLAIGWDAANWTHNAADENLCTMVVVLLHAAWWVDWEKVHKPPQAHAIAHWEGSDKHKNVVKYNMR